MLMKDADIALRRRLLERWGYVCVVCGREFSNLACVTKEHVVPKSAPDRFKLPENLAPAHYSCNQLRKTNTLIRAAREIDRIEKKMCPEKFLAWLNKPVPNRTVPAHALCPLRQRRFMELPERLPGMS